MARYSMVAAIFALLVVPITASKYRQTTITTVDIGEEHPSQCRRQQLDACQRYLEQSSQPSGSVWNGKNSWREEFQQCCKQLEQVDEQCRCEGIRTVVKQQGELQGLEMQEMLLTARSLPGLCRIRPQRCEIPNVWL